MGKYFFSGFTPWPLFCEGKFFSHQEMFFKKEKTTISLKITDLNNK